MRTGGDRYDDSAGRTQGKLDPTISLMAPRQSIHVSRKVTGHTRQYAIILSWRASSATVDHVCLHNLQNRTSERETGDSATSSRALGGGRLPVGLARPADGNRC